MNAVEMKTIFDRINLCGCGLSQWPIIKMLLERGEDHDRNGSYYDLVPQAEYTWIEFGAKVIDSWHLTEHGTSIGWAWLTEDGKKLLAWLREFGTDDNEWPEGWDHGIGCPCGCEEKL